MTTKDYFDDIHAPRATAIVPSVTAVVRDGGGRVLLVEQAGTGLWTAPSGEQEIGESVVGAVRREVRARTGIEASVTGLSGIYSDPRHVVVHAADDVRQEFALCFHAEPTGGELRPGTGFSRAWWAEPASIGELPVQRAMRMRIDMAIAEPGTVHIG
ncbi:NUDIX hydrolase [Prauserella marina]|uniref:ADP-ribose pyrophosphatase YjhB, NUDIX family n=1 Tax=Prauserella marina TaxID=530584 RepID=A0A222VMS5_9PSEU|nr:NUDIX domain-containing protein [Prauserella marina]ASR35220.1 NUDIX hydrolase [Prauserella marina]PWV85012.1 ADP-ribose pyrophosphatase YjhB (NUDIX family) [Prauserella marina]SDC06878.1 ADP-ribose pyrophosphatase YjhB, NUDIX family [Prauserella marina]